MSSLRGDDVRAKGIPTADELLRRYWHARGRASRHPDRHFGYYGAFMIWKNAIILQGIAARNRRGQASSAAAGMMEQMVEPLGELAWEACVKAEGELSVSSSRL